MEGRPLEEERELIVLARDGDVRAYELLVQRHQDAAFRTAYLVAGSTGEAEDAAQEAFVKAYRALSRFRTGAPFRPWLLAIVANEARSRLRSAARRGALTLRLSESRLDGDAAPSPESAALARSEQENLVAAISRLDEKDRLVIGYRYLLELSEKDMAVALGIRPGTVKSRLARALGRLRVVMMTVGSQEEDS